MRLTSTETIRFIRDVEKVGERVWRWRVGRGLYTYRYTVTTSHPIVQELCEGRGGRPGLSVLTSLLASVDVRIIEPCFGIGHNLSLICQLTSEDIKHQLIMSPPEWLVH